MFPPKTKWRITSGRVVKAKAFSLIELLVAMGILTMLALLVTQVIGLTSQSVALTSKRLDAEGQARQALDWLGNDFTNRLKRPDLPPLPEKAPGNDAISFYSQADSYASSRRVAVVAYRIEENAQEFQLSRGVQGTAWASGQGIGFGQTVPAIANADYEILSEGILRLEFCYLKTDGTLSNSAAADWQDISAVVVAVAVVDHSTRKILSGADLQTLSDSLPDSEEGQTPIAGWHAARLLPEFGEDVPKPGVENIRFYQRFYYVR